MTATIILTSAATAIESNANEIIEYQIQDRSRESGRVLAVLCSSG